MLLIFFIIIILTVIIWKSYKIQQKRNILILEIHIKKHFQDEYEEKIKSVEYVGKSKLALHFKAISDSGKIYKLSAISSGLAYHFDEGWK